MKNLLLLLGLVLPVAFLQAQQIELVSQTSDAITLRCQLDGFTTQTVQTPQGEAVRIQITEGTPLLRAGAPEVPKLTASFIAGQYETGKVWVESVSHTDYENYLLAPSKGNLYRNVDPATVPYEFGAAYERDAFFPSDLVRLRESYVLRDFRGQTAVFYPVQYNPMTQTLRVHEELLVTIELKEDEALAEQRAARAQQPVPMSYHNIYQERFLNYGTDSRYEQVSELGNMLIIATDAFAPQLDELVRWKNQKGIVTEVVTVEEIGNTPEVVKTYVDEYYAERGLTFLLLVGDETMVPTQQTTQQNACDHCYSHQLGDDHYPDFFVGRFNAETAEELQTMIDRNMIYERTPSMDNPDWFQTAIGLGSNEGPGDDGEYDFEHLNNLKTEFLDFGFAEVYEFYEGSQAEHSPTPGSPTADLDGFPETETINAAVNNGATILNYTGHGWHSGLSSGDFSNDAVNALTNQGAYPFLVAVACCVGDFQGDFGNGACLGDAWIRATHEETGEPTGGIGGCFSSILQSWSPPMEAQDEMTKLIAKTSVYDIRQTMGGLLIHGGASMIDAYGADGEIMLDTWNIFGDPSVEMWSQTPGQLTVGHPANTFIGATQLEVTCDVEGAMIGLYHQGRNIAMGIVSGGAVLLEFETLEYPEAIIVTATANNYLPYQGEVQVTPLEGPFVVLTEYTVDDATGNADGLVDYSETIDLDVTMSNVGLDVATAVQTTISTNSEAVSITSDTHLWGDIEAGGLLNEPAAFQFVVAELVEDQMIVSFTLTTTDEMGNTWERTLPIVINAPKLVLGAITVDDAVLGDGDGRLSAGETATLILNNLNQGHSISPDAIATLVTGNPYLMIEEATLDIGTIEESAAATYTVTVAEDVPVAEVINLDYTLAAGPYQLTAQTDLAVNLIIETFEQDSLEQTFGWNTPEGFEPWFLTDLQPYAGDQCLQSGTIVDGSSTVMNLSVTTIADAPLSFYRRVSSETGWDFLYFYIDGVQVGSWTGELPWAEESYDVPAGEHTFVWAYVKDDIISDGTDAAWIDDVVLPPVEMMVIDNVRDVAVANRLSVFPNPVTNTAVVSYDIGREQVVSLQLVNAQGVALRQLAAPAERVRATHQLRLDMADLPAGLYYVVLRTAAGNQLVPVVKG